MEQPLLFLMVFYYLYILALGLLMFVVRFKAVKNKKMPGRYFKAYTGEVPDDIAVFGNHYNNQFQLPILFMIACLAAFHFKAVTQTFFILAVAFVVSRIIHSLIHLGSNLVLRRAGVFFFGAFCVLGMWISTVLESFSV